MSEPRQIEVTAEDIEAGRRGKEMDCPIARAANRAFGMDYGCTFSNDDDGWHLRRGKQRYEVIDGEEFALAFDDGDPVEARIFDLLPVEVKPYQ